jgi:hypothetical protein
MKRVFPAGLLAVVILFSVSLSAPLFAVDDRDFDAVTDFSVTIKTLNQLDETAAGAYGLFDRFLLLDGTVSNVLILDANEESFLVQVELIAGEWIGLEEVRSYSCWVVFAGPRFFPVFPRRVPRNAPPNIITTNDRVLVVARILQTVELENGESAWVLEGIRVRPLR